MNYKVVLSRDAEHFLARLDKSMQARIVLALRQLSSNPFAPTLDCKSLSGRPNEYRLRIGKYRAIYTVEHDILMICVVTIASRGDIYKK